jgi:hypothetical protein
MIESPPDQRKSADEHCAAIAQQMHSFQACLLRASGAASVVPKRPHIIQGVSPCAMHRVHGAHCSLDSTQHFQGVI